MAKLKNIEKVAKILRGVPDRFSDGSQSWILLEDEHHSINILFDGKGNKFEGIQVAKKVYAIVDEPIIAEIKAK